MRHRLLSTIVILIFLSLSLNGQSVAINDTGTLPDSMSMLDVQSPNHETTILIHNQFEPNQGNPAIGNEILMDNGHKNSAIGTETTIIDTAGFRVGNIIDYREFKTGLIHGYFMKAEKEGGGQRIGSRHTIKNMTSGYHLGTINELLSKGTSDVTGQQNEMTGTSSGLVYGVINSINHNGSGIHYGHYNMLSGNGAGLRYGSYHTLAGSGGGAQYGNYHEILNSGNGDHFGSYQILSGSGSGDKYGSFQKIDNAGSGMQFGSYNEISGSGSGSGARYGSYQTIHNLSNGSDIYGLFTELTVGSIGNKYGSFQSVSNAGSGISFGTYNVLGGAGSGPQYGAYHVVTNTGNASHFGTFNSLSAGSGNKYGSYQFLSGTGPKYGTLDTIVSSGSDIHYGSYSVISGTGSGNIYGDYNLVESVGNGSQFGSYNELKGEGSGLRYGSFNVIEFTSSNPHFGCYNKIGGEGSGLRYGVYNRMEGTGNGARSGVRTEIVDSGNGEHHGVYNSVSGSSTGARYGVRNLIFGQGAGTHYGTYNSLTSIGNGTHYAGYFNAPGGANDFAAVFNEGHVVANEAGGNYDFRIESQNNQNLFFTDASADRIGIRTPFPSATLQIDAPLSSEALRIKIGASTKIRLFGNGSLSIGTNNENVSANDVYFHHQIGLGIANPSYRLDLPNNTVDSIGRARAQSWVTYSDQRVKRNVLPLSYGLDALLLLKPVQYDHHASTFENGMLEILDEAQPEIGFLAQEVHKVIHEIVHQPADEASDLWTLNYNQLTPVLVLAIQEQQEIINQQKKMNMKQERLIETLMERLQTLEKLVLNDQRTVQK